MKSLALTFLTPDEAPLSAHVDEALDAYRDVYGDGDAMKHAMLVLLKSSPQAFRERFPLRKASR